MTDTVLPLQVAYDHAKGDRLCLVDDRDRKRRAMIAEATKAIDAELEIEFGERLTALRGAEAAACAAYQAACIAEGTEFVRTRNYKTLVEWERRDGNFYTENRNAKYRTGRTGQLEVRVQGTPFPDNQHWGLPEIGEVFLRVLKKDGTPGKNYHRLHGQGHRELPGTWFAEGDIPKHGVIE